MCMRYVYQQTAADCIRSTFLCYFYQHAIYLASLIIIGVKLKPRTFPRIPSFHQRMNARESLSHLSSANRSILRITHKSTWLCESATQHPPSMIWQKHSSITKFLCSIPSKIIRCEWWMIALEWKRFSSSIRIRKTVLQTVNSSKLCVLHNGGFGYAREASIIRCIFISNQTNSMSFFSKPRDTTVV